MSRAMSAADLPREEREQLAAELALGVLEGEELARARALLAEDAEFRTEVGHWQGRFAPMLLEVQPVEPPMHVWGAIERRVCGAAAAIEIGRRACGEKAGISVG